MASEKARKLLKEFSRQEYLEAEENGPPPSPNVDELIAAIVEAERGEPSEAEIVAAGVRFVNDESFGDPPSRKRGEPPDISTLKIIAEEPCNKSHEQMAQSACDHFLIGPNRCSRCGGAYGEHRKDCDKKRGEPSQGEGQPPPFAFTPKEGSKCGMCGEPLSLSHLHEAHRGALGLPDVGKEKG